MKVDLKSYEQYLKEHLSEKRFQHSVNVSEASAALAERFGCAIRRKHGLPDWCTISVRKNRRMCSTPG